MTQRIIPLRNNHRIKTFHHFSISNDVNRHLADRNETRAVWGDVVSWGLLHSLGIKYRQKVLESTLLWAIIQLIWA